jgi:two-component system LytT family response regulator
MVITALIIDDERRSRETLASLIEKYCPAIKIIGFADSASTGAEAIKLHSPNLVFLDIEMPFGSGFDMLEKLGNYSFEVVFTTAYDQYALRAFKFSALDYLLKPIDRDELVEAVSRVEKRVSKKQHNLSREANEHLEVLLYNIKNKHLHSSKIALPTSDGIVFVQVNDIIRCESERNYTYFYMVGGEKILITRTLKEFELMLADFDFFRVHHSHLINLAYVKRYVKSDGGSLIMNDDSIVQISRKYKDILLQKLARM